MYFESEGQSKTDRHFASLNAKQSWYDFNKDNAF